MIGVIQKASPMMTMKQINTVPILLDEQEFIYIHHFNGHFAGKPG